MFTAVSVLCGLLLFTFQKKDFEWALNVNLNISCHESLACDTESVTFVIVARLQELSRDINLLVWGSLCQKD